MDFILSVMQEAKLFDGFSEQECAEICSSLKPGLKSFLKNQVLIHEGDKVDYVGIVGKGKVASAKLDYEGNASLLYMLEPPKLFGLEIAATPTQISSITVTGVEDSMVILFPYGGLTSGRGLSGRFQNKLMQNMLTIVANENMRRMYKIELLCQKSLRERILTYLRFQSGKKGSSSFTIPFNRDQLAQYLNVNRSALSHELSLMQRQGLISFFKNQFQLHIK